MDLKTKIEERIADLKALWSALATKPGYTPDCLTIMGKIHTLEWVLEELENGT